MTGSSDRRPDQLGQGIVLILASVAAMAFGDAMVKHLSADLTVWQVFVARSLVALPCLLAIGLFRALDLSALLDRWALLRSALLVLTWLAFYASLPVLTLSTAAVAVYTNPILTALISALALGERVSMRQGFGVLLGFAGVAAILRPGTDAFTWMILLPLTAATLYSSAMVLTRGRCQRHGAVSLALGLHGGFLLAGLVATGALAALNLDPASAAVAPFLLGSWAPMGWSDWALMALLGVLAAGFSFGVARAYQIAPPHIIGAFDYGYLVSAALWGFVIFAEEPDALTFLGMALITLAGLLVAHRVGDPAAPDAALCGRRRV